MSKALPKTKRLIPISQAAKVLGVSIDTVRRWDEQGALHAERPNGKDRYFSIDELEKIKYQHPLTISQASKQLGISQTTLRRLERKGLIKPERNQNGERLYTRESIKNFLDSEYFLKQRQVEEKILEPFKEPEKREGTTHKIITAAQNEIRDEVIGLQQFKKAFYASGLFLFTLFILLVFIITALFLLFPEQTAKFFGYSSSPKAAVLGATYPGLIPRQEGQVLGEILKPISMVSLGVVKQISPDSYEKIVPKKVMEDVNDILTIDGNGNISPLYNITVPDTSYLKIPDTELITNLNAEYLQGRTFGTAQGDLAVFSGPGIIEGLIDEVGEIKSDSTRLKVSTNGNLNTLSLDLTGITADISKDSVKTEHIKDGEVKEGDIAGGAISEDKLAGTLSFDDGDFLNLSAIVHDDTGTQGLRLPNVSSATPSSPSTGEGYIAYDTAGDQLVIYNGTSWTTVSSGGSGDITSVSAGSGLTGGGETGAVTLNIGVGTGISINDDDIAINQAFTPTWTGAHTFEGNVVISDSGADTITLGNSLDTLSIASTAFTVSSSGAISGVTTLALSGALAANGGLDIDGVFVVADGGAVTANSTVDFVFTGAEDFVVSSTITTDGAFAAQTVALAHNISSDTTEQGVLYVSNFDDAAAATGSLEALIALDNMDSNEAVLNGIYFRAGAANAPDFTNGINFDAADFTREIVFENGEAIINQSDDTLTFEDDNGTDYATLTVTALTVAGDLAITGGNITTAVTADSTLTVTGTTTFNGAFTLGDNGDTGAINTNDWDISSTGAITGVSIDANGTGNSLSNIDFDNIIASLSVDEATDINLGANALTIDMDSTGDFSIRDGATDIATFSDTGAITFTPTSSQNITVNFAGSGFLDINPVTYTNNVGALDIRRSGDFTGTTSETALDFMIIPTLNLTEPASGAFTWYGANIDMSNIAVVAGAGSSTIAALRLVANADTDVGTNYALFVDAGSTRLDGHVGIGTEPSTTIELTVAADSISANGAVVSYVGGTLNPNNASFTNHGLLSQATINSAADIYAGVTSQTVTANSAFTVSNNASFYALNPTKGAASTITNNFGLYVQDQTAGSADFGIVIEGADTAAFWISSAADNTDSANGITFGASLDTVLYRSGVDELRTNSELVVQLDGGAVTTEALCGNQADGDAADTEGIKISDCSSAPTADYMEMYPTESDIEVGDIVAPGPVYVSDADGQRIAKLTKANISYQNSIIGIASDPNKAGDFNSIGYNIKKEDRPWPVALNGRVPVKVDPLSQPIEPGDYLTSSDVKGRAKKAIKAGQMIGKALEAWNPESGQDKVLIFVATSWADPQAVLGKFTFDKEQRSVSLELSEENGTLIVKGDKGEDLFSVDSQGNAFLKGTLSAEKVKANQIEGLEIFTNRIASLSNQIAGIATSSAQTIDDGGLEEAIVNGLNLNILGTLNAQGALIVTGPAEFKNETMFEKLVTFVSNVIFKGDVAFLGRPTFNSDTAGFANIKRGDDKVEIVFEKEYSQTPLVNISITLDDLAPQGDPLQTQKAQEILEQKILQGDIRYIVTKRTTRGFTIRLNKPTPEDVKFSWTALAVRDAKTHLSQSSSGQAALVSEPISTPTPTLQASPSGQTPTPTATPTSEPTLSPSPVVTSNNNEPITNNSITINQTELGFLRVRSGPSAEEPEIGQVTPGESLQVVEELNGWYKVEFEPGKLGWVSGVYTKVTKE